MPKRTSVTPNEISLLITPLLYCVGPMRSWALRGHPCPKWATQKDARKAG